MSYVDTVAHHTAYAARSGGDPTWIRNANGGRSALVMRNQTDGLGIDVSTIATIATTVAELGKTAYEFKANKDAAKDAKDEANAAQAAAARQASKLAAEQKRVNDAQIAQISAQTVNTQKLLPIILYSVGGVAALGALFLFMRSRRARR